MSVLKGIKVDEFENVTVLIFEKISMRSKKIGERIHVSVSEADKSDIDMIIDIPNEKSLDQLILFLQDLKEDHYKK